MRIILILIFISSKLFSQEIKYKTYFLDEKIKIGDSIQLVSVINYPKEIELIQPDSSYNFSPFYFIGKKNFQSRLNKKNKIYDSTVYYLRTFQLDSIQSLNLKSFILNGTDSLIISSNSDSIYFESLVNNINENVKNNFSLNKILSIFNTYKFASFLIFIILIVFTLYFSFRKRIHQYFRKRKLIKNLNDYIKDYESLKNKMDNNKDKKILEKIILNWKRYMEKITTFPYSSSTSTEILNFNDDDKLKELLVEVDHILYSDKEMNLNNLSLKYLIFMAEKNTNNIINKIENE